ncbi:MAG: hypothetical protein ACFNZW_07690, partial [Coriobacteriaceae bacterium]
MSEARIHFLGASSLARTKISSVNPVNIMDSGIVVFGRELVYEPEPYMMSRLFLPATHGDPFLPRCRQPKLGELLFLYCEHAISLLRCPEVYP